jgi:hypothetical protein
MMYHRLKGVLVVALTLVALTARAEEPAVKKPIGKWEHTVDGIKVMVDLTADQIVLTVDVGFKIIVHGDYGMTKDGKIFAICTKVDNAGVDTAPKVDDLFSFRVVMDKDKLTISEVKPGGEEAKKFIQGEYKLVPEKK